MAFSGSSYFAGVGTVFAAIGIGFACGMMITGNVVHPPNRLERASAGATTPSKPDVAPSSTASANPEQAGPARPAAQETAPSPAVAAAASAPTAASQPAPSPQPASAAVKTDAATNAYEQPAAAARNSAPASAAKSEDASLPRNELTVGRAADRPAGSNRESSRRRKSSDDRRFSERRRRQDQDERRSDEANNTVRQLPRGQAVDEISGQDEAPRFGTRPGHFDTRPSHFEWSGDDDSPRVTRQPPPLFGFFGN